MNSYVRKPSIDDEVEAIQWLSDFSLSAEEATKPLQELGFVLGPPPSDFGCGRSVWHPVLKLLMHRGNWLCRRIDGSYIVLTDSEFQKIYIHKKDLTK